MNGSEEKFYGFSSDENFKAQKMQQELDDFTEFFDGPLSEEEQELIK